jgi:hypothetical protein
MRTPSCEGKGGAGSNRRLDRLAHLGRIDGFIEEDTMNDAHRKAAEQHELAADPHRTAAEHNEKGDDTGGRWHSERALEYLGHAYKLA